MTLGELFQLVFLTITGITSIYYLYTHFANIQAWKAIETTDPLTPSKNAASTEFFFSVLIPARNEAANIINCISSILAQDFPRSMYEVILIDDHSTDNTVSIAREKFGDSIIIINQKGEDLGGKKSALKTGIVQAQGRWIITTDADCEVPACWLSVLANEIENNQPVFIAGPVLIKSIENTWLEKFQRLDIIGMMGVTAGGIHRQAAYLANGAHLAYLKSAFENVEGFKGIDKKASGDDMLLLQKIAKKFPGQISFAKAQANAVITSAENTWAAFFQQRLRWASKGNSFPNFSTWLQMVLIFIFCSAVIFSLLLLPFNFYFFGTIAIILYIIKFLADYFYLRHLCHYFNSRELINSIWWATLFHAIYIFIIGISAQFYKTYEWKGRNIE